MVPLSAFAKWTTDPGRAAVDQPPGRSFPPITISFNLAPGRRARPGDRGDPAGGARSAVCRPALSTTFQGNAQAFQESLTTVPLLILAALVVVYIILGVLYESFIHPLTILSTLPSAGFGALATLMLFGYEFSLIALIGIDPADRHRQEERHHDGRLRHRRRTRRASDDRAVDPQGGAAALPPDHDDDDGGDARRRAADARPRHRLGAAPAARLHDGRRPASSARR